MNPAAGRVLHAIEEELDEVSLEDCNGSYNTTCTVSTDNSARTNVNANKDDRARHLVNTSTSTDDDAGVARVRSSSLSSCSSTNSDSHSEGDGDGDGDDASGGSVDNDASGGSVDDDYDEESTDAEEFPSSHPEETPTATLLAFRSGSTALATTTAAFSTINPATRRCSEYEDDATAIDVSRSTPLCKLIYSVV